MPGPPQAPCGGNKRSLTDFTPASWNLWGSGEWEWKKAGDRGGVRPWGGGEPEQSNSEMDLGRAGGIERIRRH